MNRPARNTCQILPGLKPVLELLQTRPQKISRIICRKELREYEKIAALALARGIPIDLASGAELDKLCADAGHKVAHQGLCACLSKNGEIPYGQLLQETGKAPLPILLAMDQVKDPGNLGTLARTAWSLGAGGIILPEFASAKPGPAAMKSSAGALELLPVCTVANLARALDDAEEAGLVIYGTGSSANSPQKIPAQNAFTVNWQLPAVLVLGSEAKGLRPGVQKRCATLLYIPFRRSFDSLNIAQAGAILLGLCASYFYRNSL